jgi:hypothetical protein
MKPYPLLRLRMQDLWTAQTCWTLVRTPGQACALVPYTLKGEGIQAVMYLTAKKQLDALVAGTSGEDGRIGFVAATRAKDLLIIAIPHRTTDDVITSLRNFGLTEWEQGKLAMVSASTEQTAIS